MDLSPGGSRKGGGSIALCQPGRLMIKKLKRNLSGETRGVSLGCLGSGELLLKWGFSKVCEITACRKTFSGQLLPRKS